MFEAWLRDVGLTREELADEDVRIDTIRALDGGSKRRYLVRERSIPGRT
jgi:hypothetical protein